MQPSTVVSSTNFNAAKVCANRLHAVWFRPYSFVLNLMPLTKRKSLTRGLFRPYSFVLNLMPLTKRKSLTRGLFRPYSFVLNLMPLTKRESYIRIRDE